MVVVIVKNREGGKRKNYEKEENAKTDIFI